MPWPQSPDANAADERAVLFRTFLASPLIKKSSGYNEKKFSGALQIGHNSTVIGRAVDAFAHHVLLDSLRTCILVDLQGTLDSYTLSGIEIGRAHV